MKDEIFILTDGCMWEQNKVNSTYYPHAIEVVSEKTGQVRYIKSGSKISLVEGEITSTRSQETYNKQTSKMPNTRKKQLSGKGSTGGGKIKD